MGNDKTLKFLLTGLLLLLSLMQSCKKNDTPESSEYPEVLVLFSPDGLGDLSYNDRILRGIELFMNKEETDFYIGFMSPEDYEMAEFLIGQWWEEKGSARRLLVLTDPAFANMARKVIDPKAIGMEQSVLAFETEASPDPADPLRTFRLSLFGASWLAGRTARELGCTSPLIILGDGSNSVTFAGRDGFREGFQEEIPAHSMADDWQGYCMPMDAYKMMFDLDGEVDFIYSISGGTNMGIYRYLRENPDCGIFTAGMDVDQSPYSTLIVGSLVKQIDLIVYDYLNKWFDKVDVPRHQVFGLESGYVDWVIPDRYSSVRPAIEALRQEAIKKEKEYENGSL